MSVKLRYIPLNDEEAELISLAEELRLTRKLLELIHLLKERGMNLEEVLSSLKEGKVLLPDIEKLKNQIADLQRRVSELEGKAPPPPPGYSITGFWWSFDQIQNAIKSIEGEKSSVLKKMWHVLWGKRGTPQQPVSWKESSFIDRFLPKSNMPEENKLAWKLWQANLNPRHVDALIDFICDERFVTVENDIFKITEQGRKILESDKEALLTFLQRQGFIKILEVIKENVGCNKKKITEKWIPWVNSITGKKWEKPSWINPMMTYRLGFLENLGYLRQVSRRYYLTNDGQQLLQRKT